MKTTLATLALVSALAGCATPEQNLLAGVAIGAVIANQANQPTVVAPRPMRCYNQYIGRDAYGRTVYNQVCQTAR